MQVLSLQFSQVEVHNLKPFYACVIAHSSLGWEVSLVCESCPVSQIYIQERSHSDGYAAHHGVKVRICLALVNSSSARMHAATQVCSKFTPHSTLRYSYTQLEAYRYSSRAGSKYPQTNN